MSPSEAQGIRSAHARLWPQSRWNDEEWSVVYEKAARIDIDPDQVQAALRNLKATVDGCPSVAALLGALKQAEGPKAPPSTRHVTEAVYGYQHEYDENGHTSFERRVIDDPRFREYARKAGRLPKARERAILAGEINTTRFLEKAQ